MHVEADARAVDVRRLDLDAHALAVAAEFGELVGVGDVERQGGGHELDGVVRLEIGGLVADDRIGGGVALVEAVIRELGEKVEDL